jgi:response regulator RpfG family c-di-GMP phosphodiesterase
LARTLRHEPYDLLYASDTGEAEAILRQRPDVRAVICDHYMPGVLGLDFVLHQRRVRPALVTILLTAQADIRMVLTALNEGGIHRFFTKPWDGPEVRRALRQLLGLAAEAPDAAGARVRRDAERLDRTMAPQRDADGAFLIGPPEGGWKPSA